MNILRVAIDQSIAKGLIVDKRLEANNIEIVYNAKDHDYDEQWVDRAYILGADVFISPDLDIPNIMDFYGVEGFWLDVPQNLGGYNQINYLITELCKIKKKLEEC